MSEAFQVRTRAVEARDAAQTQQAEIDAARWSFDLRAAQLIVDAAAGDAAGLTEITSPNLQLGELQSASGDGDFTSASNVAEHIRNTINQTQQRAETRP